MPTPSRSRRAAHSREPLSGETLADETIADGPISDDSLADDSLAGESYRRSSRSSGSSRSSHSSRSARSTKHAPASRSRRNRSPLGIVGQLPNFLRLLYGLLTDSRVDVVDKALVGAAIGYVIMPVDLIPDFIPFIGEVDDVFVLMLAIRRLMEHAGSEVLLDHWMGDPEELVELNLQKMLGTASFFLPRRLRRRLRTIGRV